ncbi:MAG: DUF2306 domain-containing protein, partial [Marinirhabdus sp.]
RKGSSKHKKSGLYFFYCMTVSAFLALIIAFLPGHYSPFLFSIGLFGLYFLITGFTALRYKRKVKTVMPEIVMNCTMIGICLGMVVLPILFQGNSNTVLLVFGLFGLLAAINTLRSLLHKTTLRKRWLRMHLGNMMGGYIAAFTAFIVVNQVLPGLLNWFAPGIIGGFYIWYWMRKTRSGKKPATK